MEILFDIISQPFSWGLLMGLVIVCFVWSSCSKDKKHLKNEVKRLQDELDTLTNHLSTQLKINAEGNNKQQKELEELREQNENLRVNLQAIQQKPGKLEMRKLEVTETAVSVLREQAPGFAAAWEKALRQAEDDYVASESGLQKLIRKVNPRFRATADTSSKNLEVNNDMGT